MYHIEFCGLPGAGKSSIIRALINQKKELGHKCISDKEALLLSLSNSTIDFPINPLIKIIPKQLLLKYIKNIFHRSLFFSKNIFEFLSQYGDSINAFYSSNIYKLFNYQEKYFAISHFLKFASYYLMIDKNFNQNISVLFDEGFIQRSMSFFLSPKILTDENYYSDLKKYLNAVPLPDYIIYINTDIDECIKHMESRENKLPLRMEGMIYNEIKKYLNKIKHHFDFLTKFIVEKRSKIITVNNNSTIDEAVKLVMYTIQ